MVYSNSMLYSNSKTRQIHLILYRIRIAKPPQDILGFLFWLYKTKHQLKKANWSPHSFSAPVDQLQYPANFLSLFST